MRSAHQNSALPGQAAHQLLAPDFREAQQKRIIGVMTNTPARRVIHSKIKTYAANVYRPETCLYPLYYCGERAYGFARLRAASRGFARLRAASCGFVRLRAACGGLCGLWRFDVCNRRNRRNGLSYRGCTPVESSKGPAGVWDGAKISW